MADFQEYYTKEGDRLDLIAYDFYDDPFKYQDIIQENRDVLIAVTNTDGQIDDIIPIEKSLPADLRLLIPIVEETAKRAEVLPPWE